MRSSRPVRSAPCHWGDRAADGSCLRLNSFVGAREREQALYGFKDMCDVIVYSHEVGWLKPDPRVYRVACERLGCAPDEAVLLDDVADVEALLR
jgi:beta-phosphoglucomutase-like phosphatase (HAD superfamily)